MPSGELSAAAETVIANWVTSPEAISQREVLAAYAWPITLHFFVSHRSAARVKFGGSSCSTHPLVKQRELGRN